jgi:hypothetical protein
MDFLQRPLPFQHLLISEFFTKDAEIQCIKALQTVQWKRTATEFYRIDIPFPGTAHDRLQNVIREAGPWDRARLHFEDVFSCRLDCAVRFEIHRYGFGCGIGPHTDAPSKDVRCLINLNAGWNAKDGGIWIMAADSALAQHRSYVPSLSNAGFAFPTSETSYHALSIRHAGVHYGITSRFLRM